MPLEHLRQCSQLTPPTVWQGATERMQTCPECLRCAPAEPGAALTKKFRGEIPVIPSPPYLVRAGWPTHRARRRMAVARRRRRRRNPSLTTNTDRRPTRRTYA